MRVFVASATADSSWVDKLRVLLTTRDEPAWQAVPPIGPHPNWKEQAREAIEACDALLFVTSSRSAVSPHCAWELSTALGLGKPCFQWVVEPVSVSYEASSLPVVGTGDADDAYLWTFPS